MEILIQTSAQFNSTIYSLVSSIISNVQVGATQFTNGANMDELKESVQNLNGFMPKVMLCARIAIIWFAFEFASMMITLITLARIIELYIYTAIAAISIATLFGGELSSIGKNF